MSANPDSIRILTADDHPLFRSGIAAILATQPDMNLVAEASNGQNRQGASQEYPLQIGRERSNPCSNDRRETRNYSVLATRKSDVFAPIGALSVFLNSIG